MNNTSNKIKRLKSKTPLKKTPPPATKSSLSKSQMGILAGLLAMACLIWFGIAGGLYLYRETLWPPPPTVQVAALTITPTVTLTPSPTSTIALPEALPTLEPTPTATYAVAPEFINKDKIADITRYVEVVRQLRLPHKIPTNFLTRSQLRQQWQAESFDKAIVEGAKTQRQLYLALGLIDPQLDLAAATLDFQTNSLMGYYVPANKSLYLIAESVNMFADEEMTFAHEYMHALQDYHFGLDSLTLPDASADAQLAARALSEGDARLVEDLFTAQNITDDQLEYSSYRYLLQKQPDIEGVSPALGILTFFPYTAGEYFVLYLFMNGDLSWQLVNQAYSKPPVSSEQILHPEKYLAGEMPVSVKLPDLSPVLADGWQELDQNVLGEIGLLVWLIDQVEQDTAIEGAAGWDGDGYTLWANAETDDYLLAQVSVWETQSEADQFSTAFGLKMDLREGETSRQTERDFSLWNGQSEVTFISQQGRQILIIIAPDKETLNQVRYQF